MEQHSVHSGPHRLPDDASSERGAHNCDTEHLAEHIAYKRVAECIAEPVAHNL